MITLHKFDKISESDVTKTKKAMGTILETYIFGMERIVAESTLTSGNFRRFDFFAWKHIIC